MRALIAIVALYLAALGVMYLVQRNFIYFPSREIVDPPEWIEALRLRTPDGERLVAWYAEPAAPGRPVFLFLDGNGGAPERNLARWNAIRQMGAGFLAVYYRGYSGSTGTPTERGLHTDARTAYDWLRGRHSPRDIVIHGFSLGSGVATRLARDVPARALVLEAPFTAAVDVAQRIYPLIPAHILMRDQFRSRDWIGAVHMPVLIVHGDADEQIPFRQGERLFAMASDPKRFVRIEGGMHDTLVAHGLYGAVGSFLAEEAPGAAPSAAVVQEAAPAE